MSELSKYQGIYSTKSIPGYGHSNHGSGALPLLLSWKPESLLDVGCGYNEFVRNVVKLLPDLNSIGVDFACPGADIIADAASLPFSLKEFDVITSFDMLEHVEPEKVDIVLSEFARVSHRFIFSICYRPSVFLWQGQNLHPTVQKESWWLDRIQNAGGIPMKNGKYIVGHWG
jgi:SAM-dependent methyltransferase